MVCQYADRWLCRNTACGSIVEAIQSMGFSRAPMEPQGLAQLKKRCHFPGFFIARGSGRRAEKLCHKNFFSRNILCVYAQTISVSTRRQLKISLASFRLDFMNRRKA